MSVDLVKEQIYEFLKSDEPQVIAVKGRWGVGKTYAWNQFIGEFKNDIELKSYAYVSLFGANSLGDIKRAVFENTIDTALIGDCDNLAALKNNYKSLGKKIGRKSGSSLKEFVKPVSNLVLKGLGSSIDKAYESFAFAMLDKTLICFDDLERHSAQVSLRDFLGLVSYFKEQKNCKIVILLNEDSNGLDEYLIYKEKVIDKQLHFEPTAAECFDIAIKEQSHYQHIRDVCLRLDIRNIRVLNKIKLHVNSSLLLIQHYDGKIQDQIIQSIIIICWSYYCHSSDEQQIPSLSFIKSLHSRDQNSSDFATFERTEGKDQETTESKWEQKLISYNYAIYDSLSVVIIASIEKGFIDKATLTEVCDVKQNEIEAQKANEAYSKAWDVFHHSFDNNESEVIELMNNGLRSAVKNLSSSQYSSGVGLIRDLGDEQLAEGLTDFFIENNQDDIERLNINSWDSHPFGVKDHKFGTRVQEYKSTMTT